LKGKNKWIKSLTSVPPCRYGSIIYPDPVRYRFVRRMGFLLLFFIIFHLNEVFELQNLREAIANYRNSILRQSDEMKREASLSFFVEYLERYYSLICFAVYIHSERDALRSSSFGHSSFADWMRARPELYSIIRR
jgi:hypothetical protein